MQATIDMADQLIPGFTDFHPIGARLGQECVRITAGDFRSMIFPTQYHLPTYNRWLLDQADLAPAYRWHRQVLQHLQSRHPADQWLLKSPAHLWHLDALAGEYPDAVVVQTHRDPAAGGGVGERAGRPPAPHGLRRPDGGRGGPAVRRPTSSRAWTGAWMPATGACSRPSSWSTSTTPTFVADPMAAVEAIYDAIGRELTVDRPSAHARLPGGPSR